MAPASADVVVAMTGLYDSYARQSGVEPPAGKQALGPAGESLQAPFKTTALVDAKAMPPKSKLKNPVTSLPTQEPEEPIK